MNVHTKCLMRTGANARSFNSLGETAIKILVHGVPVRIDPRPVITGIGCIYTTEAIISQLTSDISLGYCFGSA
jgi:hypothetical protein